MSQSKPAQSKPAHSAPAHSAPAQSGSAGATRPRRAVPAVLLGILLVAGLAACGEEADTPATAAEESAAAAETLTVEDPWVRATVGSDDPSMTAAFMVLDNTGDSEITVTGASTGVAGRTELHEMASVDGQMVMREIEDGLVLAPGRGQLLQPGGSHVMLMELTGELVPGDEVEVVLELSDGSTLPVTAPVKEFTEEAGHYHGEGEGHGDHDHGDHDHGDDDHGDDDHGDDDHGDDGHGHP